MAAEDPGAEPDGTQRNYSVLSSHARFMQDTHDDLHSILHMLIPMSGWI